MTTIDMESLANGVEESTDPITPDTGVPDVENETKRENVFDYVKDFVGTERLRREKRERKPRAKKPVPPKPREGALVKPLMDMYGSIGMAVSMFDPQCGFAVMTNAEKCAQAMESLARENPAVRRVVMQMIETSVWGQLIAAHMPIVYAVALHHVPHLKESPMGKMQTAAFEARIAQQKAAEEAEMAEAMAAYQRMQGAA